jgi:hypothetical protein
VVKKYLLAQNTSYRMFLRNIRLVKTMEGHKNIAEVEAVFSDLNNGRGHGYVQYVWFDVCGVSYFIYFF